jgi:hypothetical protein
MLGNVLERVEQTPFDTRLCDPRLGRTRLHMRMDPTGLPHDDDGGRLEEQYAPNMYFGRVYANLPYRMELNGELRFVDTVAGQEVAAYADGNVNVSRAIAHGLRLTVSGVNLLHRRHTEWAGGEQWLARGVRAGLDWRF